MYGTVTVYTGTESVKYRVSKEEIEKLKKEVNNLEVTRVTFTHSPSHRSTVCAGRTVCVNLLNVQVFEILDYDTMY